MTITVFSEADIRASVQMDAETQAAVADGFSRLTQGRAFAPPVIIVEVPDQGGEIDIKTAYIQGLGNIAIKVASVFSGNAAKGLADYTASMVLLDAETGYLQAILADNGYLTDVRTGLAGAIAADFLAPQVIRTAGVVGSGLQARYQIRGLNLVRDFSRLLVYGVDDEQVRAYADEMRQELQLDVVGAPDAETVVRDSDFVVTTTPSRNPYLKGEWLHPGLHITCMGADEEHKQELFADCFARADRVVCDRLAQCRVIGELHHAIVAEALDEGSVDELGELTSGLKPGRKSDSEITICDLTGVGVQDTAIACVAYERGKTQGLGVTF